MAILDGQQIDIPGVPADAVEVVGARGERRSTFRAGGKRMHVCTLAPIHEPDGAGGWQPFAMDFAAEDSPWAYKAVGNRFEVRVAEHADNLPLMQARNARGDWLQLAPLRVTNDGAGIVNTQHRAVQVTTPTQHWLSRFGAVKYVGALGGGNSIAILVSDTGVRKVVHVAALPAALTGAELGIEWAWTTNLTPLVEGTEWDGSEVETEQPIELRSDDDVRRFTWRRPVAMDANGDTLMGRLRLRTTGEATQAVAVFDAEWFRNAVYPVCIDPDTYDAETTDCYINGQNAVYATARSTCTGGPTENTILAVGQRWAAPNFIDYRSPLEYDTTGVKRPVAVTWWAECSNDVSTTRDFDLMIAWPESYTMPIDAGNRDDAYDKILAAGVAGDCALWRNSLGIAVDTQYESDAISPRAINTQGMTQLGLLSQDSIDGAPQPTGNEYLWIVSSAHATVARRPTLVVTELAIPSNIDEQRTSEGQLRRIRWTWQTDDDGVAYLDTSIDGTLHRIVADHSDGEVTGATYTVKLRDPIEVDVLDGVSAFNFDATEDVFVRHAVGVPVTGYRTWGVMGTHRLTIDAGESTFGVLDLFYFPRVDLGAGVR